jgi:hypothetical protein
MDRQHSLNADSAQTDCNHTLTFEQTGPKLEWYKSPATGDKDDMKAVSENSL